MLAAIHIFGMDCSFFPLDWTLFFPSFVFSRLTTMCLGLGFYTMNPAWGLLTFLYLRLRFSNKSNFVPLFLPFFFLLYLLSYPPRLLITHTLNGLLLSHRSVNFCSVFKISFLCSSIFLLLFSSSLTLS